MKTLQELEYEIQDKILELSQQIASKDEELKQIKITRNNSNKYTDKRVNPQYVIKQRCYIESLRCEKIRCQNKIADIRQQLKNGGQTLLADHFLTLCRLMLPTVQYEHILSLAIQLSKNGGRAEDLLKNQYETSK